MILWLLSLLDNNTLAVFPNNLVIFFLQIQMVFPQFILMTYQFLTCSCEFESQLQVPLLFDVGFSFKERQGCVFQAY